MEIFQILLPNEYEYQVLSKSCRANSRLETSGKPVIIQLESASTNRYHLRSLQMAQATPNQEPGVALVELK